MSGKKVRVRAGLGRRHPDPDRLGRSRRARDRARAGLLLLTDPVVEPAGLEQWKDGRQQEIAERAVQPRGVLAQAEADALSPAGEARLQPLTAVQVEPSTRRPSGVAPERWSLGRPSRSRWSGTSTGPARSRSWLATSAPCRPASASGTRRCVTSGRCPGRSVPFASPGRRLPRPTRRRCGMASSPATCRRSGIRAC